MTRRRDLPARYRVQPFTRHQALGDGIPDRRLRAQDLDRLSPGLYRSRTAPVPGWARLGLPEPGHGLDPEAVAALVDLAGGAVSHQSAAHLYRIPLPARLWSGTLHVTGPTTGCRSRREPITGHRRPLRAADVTVRHGIRVTTPERTWLDVASLLGAHEVDDLVVAGDHLVGYPWVEGGRGAPVTTPQRLRKALHHTGRFKGIRLARAALPWIRVGADSPPETKLRLALITAGLPEPVLQASADAAATPGFTADLAYPQWRIALQYDGQHHRTPYQQTLDALRDQYFVDRGWVVLRVTSHDARDGFRRVVALVRRRAAAHPVPPHPPL